MLRLIVRTRPAHGAYPRYRAGLGPFGREPVEVEATDAQADALMADPALLVVKVGAGATAQDAGAPAPARKRSK